LNVVAFDNHDQIVSDLSRQDFQVSDQGMVQPVALFRRNEETARLFDSPNDRRRSPAVLILFDLLNDNLGNRGYGVDNIIRALEPLESSDSLYLYLLTKQGSIRPIRSLTSGGAENAATAIPWTRQIRPMLEAAMDRVNGLRQGSIADTADATYAAIETLAAQMAQIPGRKSIIWITHGVPISVGNSIRGVDYAPRLHRMATTLDNGGITLSSVDQGGEPGSGTKDTLEQLAELTGGQVYANDIERAIKDVMAASRSGYVIEYDAPKPDGKYHKIRVTSSRKGIRLQFKQGYYAN
jgi:VWFA-related protein